MLLGINMGIIANNGKINKQIRRHVQLNDHYYIILRMKEYLLMDSYHSDKNCIRIQ